MLRFEILNLADIGGRAWDVPLRRGGCGFRKGCKLNEIAVL
jgi:hypothetical protein